MNNRMNEKIENLKYQIKRYKAMGDGVKCQSLSNELSKLSSL